MYVAISPAFRVPFVDPREAPIKLSELPLLKTISFPALSCRSSVTEILVSVTLPVLLTVMVYCTISPTPITSSPLSTTSATLITSREDV